MRTSPEQSYIEKMDRPSDAEITERGILAEKIIADFFNMGVAGFEARLSTKDEDSGRVDIGPRQTIDIVAYQQGRPALGIQVTTALEMESQRKKMQELKDHPFVRLPEMTAQDQAIPKTLVFLKRGQVDQYIQDKDFRKHPDIAIQIFDGIIKSLKFDLAQTKNPLEISAVKALLISLEHERKKFIT